MWQFAVFRLGGFSEACKCALLNAGELEAANLQLIRFEGQTVSLMDKSCENSGNNKIPETPDITHHYEHQHYIKVSGINGLFSVNGTYRRKRGQHQANEIFSK